MYLEWLIPCSTFEKFYHLRRTGQIKVLHCLTSLLSDKFGLYGGKLHKKIYRNIEWTTENIRPFFKYRSFIWNLDKRQQRNQIILTKKAPNTHFHHLSLLWTEIRETHATGSLTGTHWLKIPGMGWMKQAYGSPETSQTVRPGGQTGNVSITVRLRKIRLIESTV